MAGGGQDRACALGWGEGFHPNRPKTVARYLTIPQTSYKCSKHRKATIAYDFTTLRSGPDEPAKLVEEGIVVREVLPIGPGLCRILKMNFRLV
jgi:hypothetical protein